VEYDKIYAAAEYELTNLQRNFCETRFGFVGIYNEGTRNDRINSRADARFKRFAILSSRQN
jgi:hypothetical protein